MKFGIWLHGVLSLSFSICKMNTWNLPQSLVRSKWSDFDGFSSSHVWMWELDYKESWVLKIWCFWTVVLEKTLESPLDCKEIQAVHPKADQPWVFIGRTDVEAELQYFGHLTWRADSFEKTLKLGKIEGQEEKGTTEGEMVGWHHRLNGHGFG